MLPAALEKDLVKPENIERGGQGVQRDGAPFRTRLQAVRPT